MFGMGPPKPVSEIMFNKFDTDKSGKIDAKEFAHLCFNLGYALTDAELSLALKVLDDDSSGEIELEEFKRWWARGDRWESIQLDEQELAKRQAAADSFNSYDPDKKGYLSRADFPQLYADLQQKGLVRGSEESALATLDRSGDGKIQFSEFIEYLKSTGIFAVKLPQAQ